MKLKLPATLLALSLAASTLPGCFNRVSGKIDDEKVKIPNGFFVQDEDFGLMIVFLTGVSNACEQYDAAFGDSEDADDAEEQAEVWAEYFPEDFWEAVIYMTVDPSDDLTDEEVDGLSWDEGFRDENEGYIEFVHYKELLDEDYFAGENDFEDYGDSYISDGGDLLITKHTEDEKIAGTFETTAVDEDGDDQGDVKVKFSVERCDDMEDRIFDF